MYSNLEIKTYRAYLILLYSVDNAIEYQTLQFTIMGQHGTVTVSVITTYKGVLKKNLFHFPTFNFYFTFSLAHTKYKPHFEYCISPDMETSLFFLKVQLLLSLSDIQLFPFISNSMQLLKELYFDLVNISAHLVL